MNVSIFGLGYVGCVSGACFAKLGHNVIGVDANPLKVDMINNGKSPIVEKDIDDIIAQTVAHGKYSATMDVAFAVNNSEIALICVGTPSNSNGSIDLGYIKRVIEQIGTSLNRKKDYFVVVIRSTVLPGTVEDVVLPILCETSKKMPGKDFGICMNPEFLRESTSVYDFFNPPKTIIGQYDQKSGDMLETLYHDISAPLKRTTIKTAEMTKYVDNSFHALKVTFANEIGNLCKAAMVDSYEVMDVFCMDTKLNLSPYYLKPGFAFGGSCLPKDLRAITYQSKLFDIEVPVLNAIMHSNRLQLFRVFGKLLEYKGKRLGFLGLSFKGGTDDLRESPIVELIELLLGKGFMLNIYDQNVMIAKLTGSNKAYIEQEIPHISTLLCRSVEELVSNAEVIVVGNYSDEFNAIIKKLRPDQTLIDLIHIVKKVDDTPAQYYGICW